MASNINEKYISIYQYFIDKQWEDFLSGREKQVLQSFRDTILDVYMLTEREKRAVMFIDSIKIDGESLSYRRSL